MSKTVKERSRHRAKIIQGQINGLIKQIEQGEYCMDILTQSLAIQRSLGSLNKLVLQNHLETCAKRQLGSGDEKQQQKAINELIGLYDLHMVKGK